MEIFARDVAFALNTLELLVAQKANTAHNRVVMLSIAPVALPVDEILNDAVNVMEGYIGHSPEVVDRFRRILHNASIKQTIQQIGPADSHGGCFRGSRKRSSILFFEEEGLVVDADSQVREDAHRLLRSTVVSLRLPLKEMKPF